MEHGPACRARQPSWITQRDAASPVQATPQNPQGRYVAKQPTFFYLPHCELDLTERLLACNVAAGTLCNVAVLGNSFDLYRERWELKHPRRKCAVGGASQTQRQNGRADGDSRETAAPEARQEEPQRVAGGGPGLEVPSEGMLCDLCQCGAVEERAVRECGFPVASAFNDMALHVFTRDWRERLARQRGGA
jgi:hypothetical protein